MKIVHMKNRRAFMLFLACLLLFLSACQKKQLVNMGSQDTGQYLCILWEERTYVPYCPIEKDASGTQIGYVNGDKKDKIYEFIGHSSNEWIINAWKYDSGAMLYREITVTNIPNGLSSEYDWN